MFKKKLVIGFLVSLLLCSFASLFVSVRAATYYNIAHWEWSTEDADTYSLQENQPSGNVYWSSYSQSFQAVGSYYVARLIVEMRRTSDLNGFLVAVIGGKDEATGLPNGTIYHSSSALAVSNLTTEASATNVTFTFNGYYSLVSGANYTWWVYLYGSTNVPTEYTYLTADNTAGGGYTLGTAGYYATGMWNGPAIDFVFQLDGFSIAGGAGDGDTVIVPPSGYTVDGTISSLMWWFVYLIVMLAPAWFLGGYLKMGKWGFVVGLAIGAGIGYAFLSGFPLWLLILVAVGEAGLVYSTVSREG